MDRFITATWYDLSEIDRDEHLDWLHGDHLPRLRDRDGCGWVAHYRNISSARMRALHVAKAADEDGRGSGSQYVLLAGWNSLESILMCPADPDTTSPDRGAKLRQRKSPESTVFNEAMRINGPAALTRVPGGTPAACIQMGMLRVTGVQAERALADWYVHARLPLIAGMSGAVGARVLTGVLGWAKYSVLYEFESREARAANFEPQEVELARALVTGETEQLPPQEREHAIPVRDLIHAPGSPIVGERLWP